MRSTVVLAVLLACIASPAAATGPDLREVDAQWNRLRLASDTAGLGALLVDDFVLTHSDGKVQHKADYLADLDRRTRVNHAIDNHDVEVRRHGDTAVVTGRTVQHGVGEQGPFRGAFRFTRVWVLQDGQWRLAASHSSRLLADAPAAASGR
jgi:ketosteroid isomerase-like protein